MAEQLLAGLPHTEEAGGQELRPELPFSEVLDLPVLQRVSYPVVVEDLQGTAVPDKSA